MAIRLTSQFLLGGLLESLYWTNVFKSFAPCVLMQRLHCALVNCACRTYDESTSNLPSKWAINCGYKPNNCVLINNLRNSDLNNLALFGLRRSSRTLITSWIYHQPLRYMMSSTSIASLLTRGTKLMGLCHPHLTLSQSKARTSTKSTTLGTVKSLIVLSNSSFAGQAMGKVRIPGSQPQTWRMHRIKLMSFTHSILVHHARLPLSFTLPCLGSFILR